MRKPSFLLLAAGLLLLASWAPAPVLAAPAVQAPAVEFAARAKLNSDGAKLRLSWPAASGKVSRYQLQRRVDGGSWANVPLATKLSLKATVRLKPYGLHRFRLRAYDSSGQAGAWALSAPLWLGVAQEQDEAITYSDGWQWLSNSGAYGGTRRTAKTAGASATFSFSATHLAWVAQRAPKRGRAAVLLDGQPIATVDLYSATKRTPEVVFTARWPDQTPRSLEIVVEGTSGRPNVDVDAFLTYSAPQTVVVAGAGDIGYCGTNNAENAHRTAAIIDALPGIAITLGDNAYPDGTAEQFAECYHPSWGRFKQRTWPAVGNHDYNSSGAAPYFEYFGSRAGQPGKGYYAHEAGTWRLYALNSECGYIGGCGVGSAQYEWLKRDLTANAHRCVLAYWHRPRFSSGYHGSSTRMADITKLLYDSRADVVLASHDHSYERLARLDASGAVDNKRGLRHFIVGTGGANLYAFTRDPLPSTVVRDNSTHGVIRLDLTPGGYSWQFLAALQGGFSDSGSGNCH